MCVCVCVCVCVCACVTELGVWQTITQSYTLHIITFIEYREINDLYLQINNCFLYCNS